MSTNKRQMRLGAFLQGVGHHVAAWRHPDVNPAEATQLAPLKHLARVAERGKFDAIFLADVVGFPAGPAERLARSTLPYYFEPLLLLSALAGVTERIGLVGTASVTYLPAYHLARKFATLDHISGGRAGWNLVTSGTEAEAQLFGLESQVPHTERYLRAREYVDVVKGLWDSFGDDPYLFDQQGGQFFDPAKLHLLDHEGKYFKVKGALQSQRPPQGYPVLVQAGSSDEGQELAAATAELVFTAQPTLEGAQAFYRGLKGRLARYGRSPDSLLIMPGLMPIVGATEAEAQEKFDQLQALIDPAVGVGVLSYLSGVDLGAYALDAPFPELPIGQGWQSRIQLFTDMAQRENLSLREVALRVAGARGHRVLVGTPASIADQMELWLDNDAADGFNILPATLPHGLDDFVNLVVPELQARGRFRKDYSGHTLREHLGLARPPAPIWNDRGE